MPTTRDAHNAQTFPADFGKSENILKERDLAILARREATRIRTGAYNDHRYRCQYTRETCCFKAYGWSIGDPTFTVTDGHW